MKYTRNNNDNEKSSGKRANRFEIVSPERLTALLIFLQFQIASQCFRKAQ